MNTLGEKKTPLWLRKISKKTKSFVESDGTMKLSIAGKMCAKYFQLFHSHQSHHYKNQQLLGAL